MLQPFTTSRNLNTIRNLHLLTVILFPCVMPVTTKCTRKKVGVGAENVNKQRVSVKFQPVLNAFFHG